MADIAGNPLAGVPRRLLGMVRPVELPGQPDARPLLFTPPKTGIRQSGRRSVGSVLLYHGGGNDRIFGFGYVIERLLAAGFSVLTGHMAGHGAGGTDLFTIDNVRARVDALWNLGRGLHGETPLFVLGQSMGGAFALDQVARGLFADKVVSVSAPTMIPRHSELLREAGCLLGVGPWRAMLYGGPLRVLPAYKGFRRDEFPVRVPPDVHYIKAFADALRELDLVSRLARLAPGRALPPIILHHGAKDGVIPVSQAKELAAALGERAAVRILLRLHHLDPLLDRNTVEGIADSLLFD